MWECGCVLAVGVRVCFWLCRSAGVFWLCGSAGVFWLCGSAGVFLLCGSAGVFLLCGCAGVWDWGHRGSVLRNRTYYIVHI